MFIFFYFFVNTFSFFLIISLYSSKIIIKKGRIIVRNFLENLSYSINRFMRGRYGFDVLSRSAIFIACILLLISSLFSAPILYYLSLVFLFWAYFRCFSRNLDRRGRELCKFLSIKNKFTAKINRRKKMFAQRRTHKFFKCPKCGTYSRVPKGKGKIKITCGVCKNEMIKRT